MSATKKVASSVAWPLKSTLDDDGQYVAILQLMVQSHPLVVELGTRSPNSGKAELPHEITVELHTDVLHRGVVLDNERFLHVSFLALRLEEDPHEAEVIVDEILEFIESNILER